jgi:hypothetical protein
VLRLLLFRIAMTDSFQLSSETDRTSSQPIEQPIDIKLPPEVAAAIVQRMEQSGQTQAQVILETLQAAFLRAANQTPDELQGLQQRMTELEKLIPRLAALEGKSIAF